MSVSPSILRSRFLLCSSEYSGNVNVSAKLSIIFKLCSHHFDNYRIYCEMLTFEQPQNIDDCSNLSVHPSYDIHSERGERCSFSSVFNNEEEAGPWILTISSWTSRNPESTRIGYNASISFVSRCHFPAMIFVTRVFRNLDEQRCITMDLRKSPLILRRYTSH